MHSVSLQRLVLHFVRPEATAMTRPSACVVVALAAPGLPAAAQALSAAGQWLTTPPTLRAANWHHLSFCATVYAVNQQLHWLHACNHNYQVPAAAPEGRCELGFDVNPSSYLPSGPFLFCLFFVFLSSRTDWSIAWWIITRPESRKAFGSWDSGLGLWTSGHKWWIDCGSGKWRNCDASLQLFEI